MIENGSVKRTTVAMDTAAAVAELMDIASSYAATGVVPIDELDEVQYFWFTNWDDRVYKVKIRNTDADEAKNTSETNESLVKDDGDERVKDEDEDEDDQIVLPPLESDIRASDHANDAVESMMALMRGTNNEMYANGKLNPIASQPYISAIFIEPVVDIWTAEIFSQGVMSRRYEGVKHRASPHVDSYRDTEKSHLLCLLQCFPISRC